MLELTMIIGGALLRLVPHMPNFSSISATALFGGAKMKKRYALLIPLLIIAVTDYLLLYTNPFGANAGSVTTTGETFHFLPLTAMFHSTTPFVWGSFMISGLIGIWLRNHQKPSTIVTASLLSSIQFFLITNFGVWAMGAYSRGLDGLLTSYIMGLPFFQWTLLGDLFYTTIFFSTYAIAKKNQTSTRNQLVSNESLAV